MVQKWVFRPAGATGCPDKREMWRGGADRVKFHVYRGRNVGIQPLKLSKFQNLAINMCLRGDSFAVFLRNSQRLYSSICSFQMFSLVAVGDNEHIISIFLGGGTNFQ